MNDMYLSSAGLSSADAAQEASAGVKKRTKPIDPVVIGERVRQARIAARLTQQELAGGAYSKSYISALERGKMTPSFQALRLLAARLDRPLSFFFGEGEIDLETLAQASVAAYLLPGEEQQQREAAARQMLTQAEEWVGKGQPDQALTALRVADNEPPTTLPHYERPRWYWLAGRALVAGRKLSEAIGWLERGIELIETLRPRAPASQRARLGELAERMRDLLGGCYYELGQPAKAREYHLRCLRAITDGIVTDPELRLMIYQSLGNDHMALGCHKEAIGYYEQTRKLAQDTNNPRQEAIAWWGLGLVYKSGGDLFHAEAAFQKALDTFERMDNMQLASQVHLMLGQVLTGLKNYPQAERHLRLGMETAARLGDAPAHRAALGNMALLHLEQGHADEAAKMAQEAVNMALERPDPLTEGQIYQTLAEAHEVRQDAVAAEQAYQRAITLLEQTRDEELIGRAHERYAQFLAAQGRFQEAYEQMGLARAFLTTKTPDQ